jgi:hypothetical protein
MDQSANHILLLGSQPGAAVDNKLGALDAKLTGTDGKVGALANRIDRLDDRIGDTDDQIGLINERIASIDDRMGSVDAHVARVEEHTAPEVVAKVVSAAHAEITARLDLLEEAMLTLAEALLRPGRRIPGQHREGESS